MTDRIQRPTFLRLSSDSDLEKGKWQNNAPVFSPMTELAISFKENCKSYSSTPRRRLSLSSIGNTPTPVRAKTLSETESIESGICMEFLSEMCDSPTIEDIRSRSRKASFPSGLSLKRPSTFRRCNSMQATRSQALAFTLTDDENSPLRMAASTEDNSIAKEMADVGLPDDLQMADSIDSVMNRSHSAPPILDSLEKYFTDIDGNVNFNTEDDGFDFIDEDQAPVMRDSQMPTGISTLLDGTILSKGKETKKLKVPCSNELDFDKENTGPLIHQGNVIHENKILGDAIFDCTFKRPSQLLKKSQKRSVSFSVKRTDSQRDFSPISSKRTRFRSNSLFGVDEQYKSPVLHKHTPSPLRLARSLSTGCQQKSDADLLKFLCEEDSNLIGDKSKVCCLPTLEKGQHQDLKAISPETLSAVFNGKFADTIHETIVIDCRYPYEFKGGHIKDAINIYTKEDIIEQFLKKPRNNPDKRMIVVFHCEFSSKRGPSLCRFLRNKDRDIHKNCYPKLYYPELYLLEGGYKAFFGQCKELCEPQEYLKMVDEDHAQDLKHFARRSKSWSEGNFRTRTGLRY